MLGFSVDGKRFVVTDHVIHHENKAVLDDQTGRVVKLTISFDEVTGKAMVTDVMQIEHPYQGKSASFIGAHFNACIAAPVKETAKFDRERSQLRKP